MERRILAGRRNKGGYTVEHSASFLILKNVTIYTTHQISSFALIIEFFIL